MGNTDWSALFPFLTHALIQLRSLSSHCCPSSVVSCPLRFSFFAFLDLGSSGISSSQSVKVFGIELAGFEDDELFVGARASVK